MGHLKLQLVGRNFFDALAKVCISTVIQIRISGSQWWDTNSTSLYGSFFPYAYYTIE